MTNDERLTNDERRTTRLNARTAFAESGLKFSEAQNLTLEKTNGMGREIRVDRPRPIADIRYHNFLAVANVFSGNQIWLVRAIAFDKLFHFRGWSGNSC